MKPSVQKIPRYLSRVLEILGRPLNSEEIRNFSAIIRRLSALILLEKELYKNHTPLKIPSIMER